MLYTRAAALVLIDELGGDDRLGLAVYSYPITETRTVSTGATGGTSRVASRTPSAGAGPAMPAVMARVAPPIASRRRPGRGGRGNSGNAGRGGGNGNGRGNSGNAGRGRGNRNGRGNSGGAGRGRGNGNGRGNSGNAGRGGGNGNGRGNSGNAGRGGGNGNGRGNPGGNGGGSGGSDPESTTRLTGHLENKIDSDFLPVKLRIPDLVPNLYASRTCIGGGMRVAIEELIAKERNNPLGEPVEKVMVLMTDGHANETEPPASNPVASIYYYASLADQHDIIIHGITLGQNAHEEPIRDAAELTGGEYHHVPDGDFEGLFEVYRGIGRGGNQPRLVK